MHLLIAYAAGLLSFFAPCGTFLLPGFLTYAFDSRVRRVTATWTFLAGFATLFLPIGLGAYVLGAQLALHRKELAWVGGLFMICMGVAALLGRGLGITPPKAISAAGRDPRHLSTIFLLGVTFGFTIAGCSAPLLAITLAMAGVSRHLLGAAALLIAYVVGLGTPLLVLSVAADLGKFRSHLQWMEKTAHLRIAGRTWEFRMANLVAGTLLILLGALFIVSQGTFYVSSFLRSSAFLDFNVNAAKALSSFR